MAYPQFKDENYQLFGGINSKASEYLNSITEFRDLSNVNFVRPGALTKRPGSTLYLGASVIGRVTSIYEFDRLNGASYIIASANTNLYNVTSTFSSIKTGLLSGGLLDFTTFVDKLWVANGQDFFKTDATNSYSFSLPEGISAGFNVTFTVGGGSFGTGTYTFSYGYINERGYYGPGSNSITLSLVGSSLCSVQYYGMTAPTGYGVTAIALYKSSVGGIENFNTTLTVASATTFSDQNIPTGAFAEPSSLFFTLAPKYLELYNNQLFMAGFSSVPSTLFWSEIGQPEDVQPEYFAEVRTNAGDRITALRPYVGSLIIGKDKTVHRLTGDNPDNFSLQEISDQYGCLSNRSMVVYNDMLWWLDKSGIVEYNGAHIGTISNKVEPIFRSMNIDAARENAVGIHNKSTNEVWFAIPTNGSTLLNTVVVYDYITQAWTKYEGLNISNMGLMRGSLSDETPFFSSYTGGISYFGVSLFSDNGNSITCMIKTRWHADRGQTSENMYRRFWLNLDPIAGSSQAISIDFRSNYNDTTIVDSRTMYQDPFQTRVDFGISARSIQAAIYHTSASYTVKVDGYSFSSRLQRET